MSEMKSETVSVQKLFKDRRQYRVPFFQRPYVWNREDQWERLWTDVSQKAEVRLDGDQPSPHFLGAAVLEPQARHGLMGVEVLNIIDGQQRFTTLQYVLASLAIIMRKEQHSTYLPLIQSCLENDNTDTMLQKEIETYKVWPTFRDRDQYQQAMTSQTLDDLRERFPNSFTQTGSLRRIGVDHSPALAALWYFAEQISIWIHEGSPERKGARLDAITEAILSDLQVVSISLGDQDDAQVIFETLNGHGAQLHATDLIRNFIFMRADREGPQANELFETMWSPFEGEFWNTGQRRGRLTKPRMEWFVQTTLQAVLGEEVEIGRLYANYREFAGGRTPMSATAQLETLNEFADHYRKLVSGSGDDPIALFGNRMLLWDASTAHSLALRIASADLQPSEKYEMFGDIFSYFVRRAVCGLPTKNYNKIFLQLLKKASTNLTPTALRKALSDLKGDASRWPADAEFKNAWLSEPLYPGHLDAPRTKTILVALETALRTPRTEEPLPQGLENLDIDHIMPTSWFEFWELPDQTKSSATEAAEAMLAQLTGVEPTERQRVIRQREEAKVTIGNLTLVHYGVNRGLQHRGFAKKRQKLFEESNLHLNRPLMNLDAWNEEAILRRGQALFEKAVVLWPGPDRSAVAIS